MPTRFAREDIAYDYMLDSDQDNPLPLVFARDGDLVQWTGQHMAAIESEQLRYRESQLAWKSSGVGSGHSRRTPATTGRTAEGAILSGGISYGEWITSVVPDILMPSGEATELLISSSDAVTNSRIHSAIDFDGTVYLATGNRYVLKIANGTATTVDVAMDAGAGATLYEVEQFDGSLVVTGGSGKMWASTDGSSWNDSEATVNRRRLKVVNWIIGAALATEGASTLAGTPITTLVSMDPDMRSMYHCPEGQSPLLDASWSGATTITTAPYYVNDIVGNNHTVWFAANNGVYGVNELGQVANLTEWMRLHYAVTNGDQSCYQDGLIWFGHESGLAVLPVDGTRQDFARWAQFGYLTPNQTPIYGRPQVVRPGGDCIWVGYYATSTDTSYVFRLIVDRSDGGLTLRWSGPEAVFVGQGLDMVQRVSPLDAVPYLLIATRDFHTNETHLWKQSLPVSGNPYTDWRNDTGHRFAPAWKVYLPRDDFDSTAPKSIRRYDMVAQNLTDGNSVVIEASADDGDYSTQGTANLSPRATILPSGDYLTGVNFNWRLSGTNDPTVPIVLEAFSVRASVLVEPSDVQTFPVLLARQQSLLNGTTEERDPYTDWRRLRRYQTRGPITVVDMFGVTKTAKVEPGMPYRVVWDARRREWVLVAMVTVSTLHEPAFYDSGDAYEDGSAYVGSAAS